jgi:hypothetical protein
MSKPRNIVIFIVIFITSGFALSQDAKLASTLVKKHQIYVGVEVCNNGEVTTYEKHKGCKAQPIGYTIDDASAIPIGNFTKIYTGNDIMNNQIVSKNPNHLGGSMKSIGYLSKLPIIGGEEIFSGNEPCNNGTATTSTRHLGCGTEPLGWALPQN